MGEKEAQNCENLLRPFLVRDHLERNHWFLEYSKCGDQIKSLVKKGKSFLHPHSNFIGKLKVHIFSSYNSQTPEFPIQL